MKSNRITIWILTLLVLCTNIAKASSVSCFNSNQSQLAPLLFPLSADWKLNKSKVDGEYYYLDLTLAQIKSNRYPIQFLVTLCAKDMIGEKVTVLKGSEKIEMNKFTFKNRPVEGSEVIIFASPDGSSYELGSFKYRSPADKNDYWVIMSDYIVGPKAADQQLIDSYSFIGSKKYTQNTDSVREFKCRYQLDN